MGQSHHVKIDHLLLLFPITQIITGEIAKSGIIYKVFYFKALRYDLLKNFI